MRIGYLSSVAVAPLIVAVKLHLFESLPFKIDAIPEIGWTSLSRKLTAGALDGAVVPATFPIAAAGAKDDKSINFEACAALGFGGMCLIANPQILKASKSGADIKKLRCGSLGAIAPDLYFARRWLQKIERSNREESLISVTLGATQRMDFLAEGLIDLYWSIEPYVSIAKNRKIAEPIICKGLYEISYPSRVLALSSNWLKLNPEARTHIINGLEAAVSWIEDPTNKEEFLAIMKEQTWNLSDEEILSLYSTTSPKQPNYSYRFSLRRPESNSLQLSKEDLFSAWKVYCLSVQKPNRDLAFSVPQWAANTFKLGTESKTK